MKDYIVRATAANAQIRAFAAVDNRTGGGGETASRYQSGGDCSAGTASDGRRHDG